MYHNASLMQWFINDRDKIFIPAHAEIDLTNICNQDCFYCNSKEFRTAQPVQMHYSNYITLLDQLSQWRNHSPTSYGTLHTITYPGGGEPTLLKGYEKVIEHTIDLGFLTSLTTNGSYLEPLYTNMPIDKLRKIAWVGVDLDSADPETYETIRNSTTKHSLFNKVIANINMLVKLGVNVDIKVLLSDYNVNPQSIIDLFELALSLGVRMLYFRPAILNDKLFELYPSTVDFIRSSSERFHMPAKINISKQQNRTYNRCHQMFQFPTFSADKNIYLCCENKGNAEFSLGNWIDNDIRELWQSQMHWDIYNNIDTGMCKPCRPNKNNNEMQSIIEENRMLECLYM
jgi:MoaA/NifB/PqqE/SkfB family radical SAM enzyme